MRGYEGHIGQRQAVILVFAVLSASLFLQFPQFLAEVAGPAAWQAALVVTAAGLILLLPAGALARRFPGRGLAEISIEAAGPFLGPVFTLMVAAWLFGASCLTLRNFTETFLTAILPDTPPSVVMLTGTACAVLASYKGIEAIARATQVLLPLIAGGVLLVLLFTLPRVDTSLFFPFWGNGLLPTVTGGLYYASIVTEALFLVVVGYAFRDGGAVRSSGLLGTLLFGLSATLAVAVLVATVGAPSARQDPFPLFGLARIIYFGRFLQRTEALIVMFWFFAAAVRYAVLLHATVVSVAGALRLPAYRPLIFPLAVIIFSVALVPEDFLVSYRLDPDVLRPAGFVALGVPLVLWLLALARGKGEPASAA